MLRPEAIKEFQEIYLKLYGLQISCDEASKKASTLLKLYKKVLTQSERGNQYESKQN